MIASTDIANILYRDCKVFGIEIVPFGETLTGELKGERRTLVQRKFLAIKSLKQRNTGKSVLWRLTFVFPTYVEVKQIQFGSMS